MNDQNRKVCLFMACALLCGFCALAGAESEPNNSIANANAVAIGATESGSLGEGADIYDLYTFTTTVDGLLQVGVSPTEELRVSLTLLDSDGVAILGSNSGSDAGSTAGVLYRNLQAGTYFASVSDIGGSGDYSVSVNFAPIEEVDAEPNDVPAQSLVLPANGEAEGHLGFHGNLVTDKYDFYKVIIGANGILELTVFPDGDLNVGLQLRDTNASEVLSAVNSKGNGESEKIVYNNLAPGTYTVLAYLSAGSGSYTLTSIYTENPNANDVEPNNSIAQAIDLSLTEEGEVYSGVVNGQLGYYGSFFQDDRDVYRITVPVYGRLDFSSKALDDHNVSVGYYLYDSQKQLTVSGNNVSLYPGTYYLRLQRSSNFGAYELTATLTPQTVPDPFNPTATDIALDTTVNGILLNEETSPVYYRLTLPADGSMTLRTTFSDTVALYGNLFHENGLYISRTDHWFTADVKEFTTPWLHAGVYYIRIDRRDGEGTGTLQTEFTAAPNVDVEPNDAWHDVMGTVTVHDTIFGHIGYNLKGVVDRTDAYILEIPDDGSLTVNSTSDDTFAYYVNVYSMREGTNVNYLGRNDGWFTTEPRSFTKDNVLAGKYLILMDRRDGYGNYEISFSFTPNRSRDPEPNDHVHEAVPIALGTGTVGHIGYDKVFRLDPSDWYSVVLPEDGSFTLTTHTESTMAIFGNVYHSDGMTYLGRTDHWHTLDPRSLTLSNMRAGTYYIQIARRDGYGAYELHTKFVEQGFKDVQQNNILSMGEVIEVGEIANGAIGYKDENYTDNSDAYRIQIPVKGTYRFSYQQDSTFASYCYIYASDLRTSPFRHDRWHTSGLSAKDMELDAGDYYIDCVNRGGHGRYSISIADVDAPFSGTLTGKIVSANNFPLAEVDCKVLERETVSDFNGQYTFETMPPGIYTVSISSGAKFYAVSRQVEIKPGETTQLDVTLYESNKTAPADPAWFDAFPRDRYIHFGWLASVSPDVADGGGYKLYINEEEPLDLGNVLSYRSDGFYNGVQYTCRLTVYDKFGNESAGQTVIVTPTGDVIEPTPTPTQPIVEPTATPRPGEPTATPTVTPQPTPTLPVGVDTPTPVVDPATPTPGKPVWEEPRLVYEFDKASIEEEGWSEVPGGFGGATPGAVIPYYGFPEGRFPTSQDQLGAAVVVKPGEVAFIKVDEAFNCEGYPVLIRCSVKSSAANAAIAVGALKGSLATGENLDGTIGYNNILSAASFVERDGRITALFRPDSGEIINPFVQVAGSDGGTVTVWIDRVDIFIIHPDFLFSGDLFGDLVEYVPHG